ncbi:MAG: terpene cyclase/mutase family protein [Gemmatimonadetes bacterium]|nr:terpene cyclase/mutase family protein [Gemmatimonadota bacterium]
MSTQTTDRTRAAGAGEGFVDTVARELAGAVNADGGWGARTGLPSNTEATALTLLAGLTTPQLASRIDASAARQWLLDRQLEDGGWPYLEVVPQSSWVTSLAVLALGRIGAGDPGLRRGIRWIAGTEGRGFPFLLWLQYKLFPEQQATELDPSLKGWPWAKDTFSWVEPTAYAILALRQHADHAGRSGADRMREGQRMLLDRACHGGGWNYGNSRILGVDIEPFPDTTALALLALQGRSSDEKTRSGLTALERMLEQNDSGLSLSLAALCYRAWNRDASVLQARLEERWNVAGFLGENRTLALALLAVAADNVFEVTRG